MPQWLIRRFLRRTCLFEVQVGRPYEKDHACWRQFTWTHISLNVHGEFLVWTACFMNCVFIETTLIPTHRGMVLLLRMPNRKTYFRESKPYDIFRYTVKTPSKSKHAATAARPCWPGDSNIRLSLTCMVQETLPSICLNWKSK